MQIENVNNSYLLSAFCCFNYKPETTINLCKNISNIKEKIVVKSHCFIFALDTMVGFVLSVNQPWITAMETCAKHSYAPFDPGENVHPEKKWTGTVKYNMSCGKVF